MDINSQIQPHDVAVHSAAGPVLLFLYTILDELRQYGQRSRKEKVKVAIYKGMTMTFRYAQIGRSVRHYSVFTKLFFCTFSLQLSEDNPSTS